MIAKGLARKIPAGSTLVFQVHYTPDGTATLDRSYAYDAEQDQAVESGGQPLHEPRERT